MSAPILTVGDTARARRTDPLSSHVAADRSAAERWAVAAAVVRLLELEGPLTGKDINSRYRFRQRGMGWPLCDFDSPRKRAGELADDDRLVAVTDGVRGHPTVYRLPDEFQLVEPPVGEVL